MATRTTSLGFPAASSIDGIEAGRHRGRDQSAHDGPAEDAARPGRADPEVAVFEQQPHAEQAGDGRAFQPDVMHQPVDGADQQDEQGGDPGSPVAAAHASGDSGQGQSADNGGDAPDGMDSEGQPVVDGASPVDRPEDGEDDVEQPRAEQGERSHPANPAAAHPAQKGGLDLRVAVGHGVVDDPRWARFRKSRLRSG